MSKSKNGGQIRIKSHICFLLILFGLLSVIGCETSDTSMVMPVKTRMMADREAPSTNENLESIREDYTQRPDMSLPEARQNIRRWLQTLSAENIQVTGDGFSCKITSPNETNEYTYTLGIRYLEIKNAGPFYYIESLPKTSFRMNSRQEAQRNGDSFRAMKYYTSKQYLADDAADFAEFQEKAQIWRALTPKPPLPERVRKFRALADDALESKDFEKALIYYEKGLRLDPMWPAGQFNAAIINGELKFYSIAVAHMKRYLALKPDAKDASSYQDKMYVWEEKANEAIASYEASVASVEGTDLSEVNPAVLKEEEKRAEEQAATLRGEKR